MEQEKNRTDGRARFSKSRSPRTQSPTFRFVDRPRGLQTPDTALHRRLSGFALHSRGHDIGEREGSHLLDHVRHTQRRVHGDSGDQQESIRRWHHHSSHYKRQDHGLLLQLGHVGHDAAAWFGPRAWTTAECGGALRCEGERPSNQTVDPRDVPKLKRFAPWLHYPL